MRVEIHHKTRDFWCIVEIAGERKSLGNLASVLDAGEVDGLKIYGYSEDRLPVSLYSLENLESLCFERCEAIRGIPSGLTRFEKLSELGFHDCADFSDLEGVSALSNLRALHVSNCFSFDRVGEELRSCEKLEMLNLSYNESLRFLSVRELPSGLKILDVRGCFELEIEVVPDDKWPALSSFAATDWSLANGAPKGSLDNLSMRLQHLALHHSRGGGAKDDAGDD